MKGRELKFRAWDKEKKEWYRPTHMAYAGRLWELLLDFEGDLNAHTMKGLEHQSNWPNRYEVMQFTGLKDKNGKDIYEGDLIECYTKSGELVYTYPHKVELPDFYREIWSENDHNLPADPGQRTKVKVVGNVWENPEMLQPPELLTK